MKKPITTFVFLGSGLTMAYGNVETPWWNKLNESKTLDQHQELPWWSQLEHLTAPDSLSSTGAEFKSLLPTPQQSETLANVPAHWAKNESPAEQKPRSLSKKQKKTQGFNKKWYHNLETSGSLAKNDKKMSSPASTSVNSETSTEPKRSFWDQVKAAIKADQHNEEPITKQVVAQNQVHAHRSLKNRNESSETDTQNTTSQQAVKNTSSPKPQKHLKTHAPAASSGKPTLSSSVKKTHYGPSFKGKRSFRRKAGDQSFSDLNPFKSIFSKKEKAASPSKPQPKPFQPNSATAKSPSPTGKRQMRHEKEKGGFSLPLALKNTFNKKSGTKNEAPTSMLKTKSTLGKQLKHNDNNNKGPGIIRETVTKKPHKTIRPHTSVKAKPSKGENRPTDTDEFKKGLKQMVTTSPEQIEKTDIKTKESTKNTSLKQKLKHLFGARKKQNQGSAENTLVKISKKKRPLSERFKRTDKPISGFNIYSEKNQSIKFSRNIDAKKQNFTGKSNIAERAKKIEKELAKEARQQPTTKPRDSKDKMVDFKTVLSQKKSVDNPPIQPSGRKFEDDKPQFKKSPTWLSSGGVVKDKFKNRSRQELKNQGASENNDASQSLGKTKSERRREKVKSEKKLRLKNILRLPGAKLGTHRKADKSSRLNKKVDGFKLMTEEDLQSGHKPQN